jgi:hypothetical protein
VVWNDNSVHLIELPFETGMEATATRKRDKYADLVTCYKVNGYWVCHAKFGPP